jgi:hypothetical protein
MPPVKPLPVSQVRVMFGERQLEMWAVGQAAAYHLHVPRLYGRIIVKKCKVKVNQVRGTSHSWLY